MYHSVYNCFVISSIVSFIMTIVIIIIFLNKNLKIES